MCISGISLAMYTISVCRILFSQHYRYVSVPSNVAAHATANSAPDHPVWFQQKPCFFFVFEICFLALHDVFLAFLTLP